MDKVFSANYYTEVKTAKRKDELVYTVNVNGFLYANGRRKTTVCAEDLPEWYIRVYYGDFTEYVSAKDIKQIVYEPALTSPHMLKDDSLLVRYDNAEARISGLNILRFLARASEYSPKAAEPVCAELEEKLAAYRESFPDTYKERLKTNDGL